MPGWDFHPRGDRVLRDAPDVAEVGGKVRVGERDVLLHRAANIYADRCAME